MNISVVKKWAVNNKLKLVSAPLAFIVSMVGTLTLFGYWVDMEQLYRPINNGPATNPLTAMCFVTGGLYVLLDTSKYTNHPLKPFFLLAVFSAVMLKLIDYLAGSHITEELSPFYYEIMSDVDYGKSNSMGLNTGLMFFVISMAFVAKGLKKYLLSQFFSTIALAIPSVSLVGYLYGLESLYRQMSLLTAVLGVLLALSILASTVDHTFLRYWQKPHISG